MSRVNGNAVHGSIIQWASVTGHLECLELARVRTTRVVKLLRYFFTTRVLDTFVSGYNSTSGHRLQSFSVFVKYLMDIFVVALAWPVVDCRLQPR